MKRKPNTMMTGYTFKSIVRIRKAVCSIILVMIPVLGIGQLYPVLPKFYLPVDSSVIQSNQNDRDDIDVGLTVGSGLVSYSGQSMMNSFLMPSINYRVSPHLLVNFTGVINNTNQSLFNRATPSVPAGDNSIPLNRDDKSFSFSASGVYQPNDRMYFAIQGQHSENSMYPFSLYPGQNQYDRDYNSISLGMGYKLSEKASIDFGFRFSGGDFPYYRPYSPVNRYIYPCGW
jgi:hypothetical protein